MKIAHVKTSASERNAVRKYFNEKKKREARKFSEWAKNTLSPEKHKFLPILVDGSGFLVGEQFWEQRAKVLAESMLLPSQKFIAKKGDMISYEAANLLEGATSVIQDYAAVF